MPGANERELGRITLYSPNGRGKRLQSVGHFSVQKPGEGNFLSSYKPQLAIVSLCNLLSELREGFLLKWVCENKVPNAGCGAGALRGAIVAGEVAG